MIHDLKVIIRTDLFKSSTIISFSIFTHFSAQLFLRITLPSYSTFNNLFMLTQSSHQRDIIVKRSILLNTNTQRTTTTKILRRGKTKKTWIETDQICQILPTWMKFLVSEKIVQTFLVKKRTMLDNLSSIFSRVVKTYILTVFTHLGKMKHWILFGKILLHKLHLLLSDHQHLVQPKRMNNLKFYEIQSLARLKSTLNSYLQLRLVVDSGWKLLNPLHHFELYIVVHFCQIFSITTLLITLFLS